MRDPLEAAVAPLRREVIDLEEAMGIDGWRERDGDSTSAFSVVHGPSFGYLILDTMLQLLYTFSSTTYPSPIPSFCIVSKTFMNSLHGIRGR